VIATRPLWAGRTLALLGITLLALNLRTAVAALSPIIGFIREDIPLDSVGLGVIGMLPPIAFATSGIVAPWVARRLGLERTLVLACLAMVLGPLVRAFADSYLPLLIGTSLALAGMGFGNILLPPAVKKYFPDRIGQVTAMYATLMAISTSTPPIVATPIAEAAGWRASFALWSVVAVSALVPWIIVTVQAHKRARADRELGIVAELPPQLMGRIGHSRVAWAITLAFLIPGLNTYALFAWMPQLLIERAGVTEVQAGALLGLFALLGFPAALIVPILASRLRNVSPIIYLGVTMFLIGYLGLLLAPSSLTWLWVACAGIGPVLFPLCLALINLRTRSTEVSVALSGFVQSVGYAISALGPLIVAIIHDLTGGWTVPILFLMATCLVGIIAGLMLARPMFVEDELAERAARHR
jgi:CP family cyanate transporter-like MFS transporter